MTSFEAKTYLNSFFSLNENFNFALVVKWILPSSPKAELWVRSPPSVPVDSQFSMSWLFFTVFLVIAHQYPINGIGCCNVTVSNEVTVLICCCTWFGMSHSASDCQNRNTRNKLHNYVCVP